MTTKRKGSRTSKAEPGENPLIPNSKLRQIYTSMVEARLFDRHLAKVQRRLKPAERVEPTFGQEACRVATAIELKTGDLVSEKEATPLTRLILNADLHSLLRELAHPRKNARKRNTVRKTQADGTAKQLPAIRDAADRIQIAMGAALALKSSKAGNVVVAYVGRRDLKGRDWKRVLTTAAKLELPIIFVVLPPAPQRKGASEIISAKVRSTGVPCIPVDSADAVALYRVAQESLGRTRSGDGPVLIECLTYRQRNETTAKHDPLIQMKRFLLQRKVGDQRSLEAAGRRFQLVLKRSQS